MPDYYDVIEVPMALSMVRDNIDSGEYVRPAAFLEDMQLIVDNCVKYNPRDAR